MLNRWIEAGLLSTLEDEGIGCIGFSPLAQGILTDRYLHGIPEGSRASENSSLPSSHLDEQTLGKVRGLTEIAAARGQSLAQLALAWALRDPRMTSLVVGASSVKQLETNVAALSNRRASPPTSWRRSTGSRPTPTSISGRSRAAGSRVPEPRTRSEAVAPQKPEVEKPTGDIPFDLVDDIVVGDGDEAVAGKRVIRPLRGRRVLERRGVRRLVEPRSAVRVQARRGPGDPRLGSGREGHEGRRSPQADDPVGDGVRRARRRNGIKPHEPLVFVVDLLAVD